MSSSDSWGEGLESCGVAVILGVILQNCTVREGEIKISVVRE